MKNLHSIQAFFENQVAQHPDDIAAIVEHQSITYGDLNKKSNQLAHYLIKMGVDLNQPVALCLHRSIDTLVCILGILKAGGAYLPLDPTHPEERLLSILNDSQAAWLLGNSKLNKAFHNYQGQYIQLDLQAEDITQQPVHNPDVRVNEHHLAYIIYTSGSTGKPKGVLIEHGSLVNYCSWFAVYSHSKMQQRIDFSSNYIFDMAVTTSIVPLMLGLQVVICQDDIKKNIRSYLLYLQENRVNTIKITPSYFHILLSETIRHFVDLPHLKNIILGGENLTSLDCQTWLDLYPKTALFNEYGPTEATVAVSQFKVDKYNAHALGLNVPIGKTGPNMVFYVLDSEKKQIAPGEIGELYIGGSCLSRGYLNQPQLTQKQFIFASIDESGQQRLYKTGDLCRQSKDGTFEYLGRIDDQIKVRGYRIEPGEIEKVLLAHPDIQEATVLAKEDRLNEKRLIAYYILKKNKPTLTDQKIREFLQHTLPEYMIPSCFVRVDYFPLTANGKLDKEALPLPQFTSGQHYQAPSTKLEKKLADIWSDELGIKSIGLSDDFFELGGHSLSAARVVLKINSAFEKDISVHEFYDAPTLKTLADLIKKTTPQKKAYSGEKTSSKHKQKHLPLSDFQRLLWMSDTFEPKAKKLNIVTRKRLQGSLDKDALLFAFNAILKKHPIFSYQIFKLRPAQMLGNLKPINIAFENLTHLKTKDTEIVLRTSMDELLKHHPWQKNSPLLMAKLFQLKDGTSELQIAMPHIITDDLSPSILLSDLSYYYQAHKHHLGLDEVKTDDGYKNYLYKEDAYSKQHWARDSHFWEKYLNNASLMPFPQSNIVKNGNAKNFQYSTYYEIPEQGLKNIKRFCSRNRVSISDGLSAALGLALYHCQDSQASLKNIVLNLVKSTRDDPEYDGTIGCFLRIDPVKVNFNQESTLQSLAQQIHTAYSETVYYQGCSNLIKLGSIGTLGKEQPVKQRLLKMLSSIYTTIFPSNALNSKILDRSVRLASFQRDNHFLININVQHDFLSQSIDPTLFGLPVSAIEPHHYDLLKIDNFLDASFIRDGNEMKPYLVISTNLKPEFRERIVKELVNIISDDRLTPISKTNTKQIEFS